MTRSVRDAITAHEILAARRVTRRHRAAVGLPAGGGQGPVPRRPRPRRRTRLRAHAADAARTPAPASRRSRCAELADLPVDQRHRRLLRRRELRLAPPAAGAQRRRLRPARGAAHPQGRDHEGPRVHRPDPRPRATGSPAWNARSRPSTRCCRPPCPSPRRPSPAWRRARSATRPSSASTRCCCATPPSSTCSTAARSRCPATPRASCPSASCSGMRALHDDALLAIALQAERALQQQH